ncbi:hypothetical protein T4A_7704 [Trichinella pseudospiralis]|uniref:Uncharacterized protein n=1 Tax=Trichinella pseudospiralis TaxID=6337 RepID=A0A0V1EF88_TRIPS|nr:hypothetical protein T4A_7704 [Trichinella pseudospiralis]
MRLALHYANKGRFKIALSSVSVHFENADDTKQIVDDKKQIADDTKQIEDYTKQNYGMKTYGICGSPRVPIL